MAKKYPQVIAKIPVKALEVLVSEAWENNSNANPNSKYTKRSERACRTAERAIKIARLKAQPLSLIHI